MTEDQWLACKHPHQVLSYLQGKASDRKLRLFLVACVRRFWQELPNDESRNAVDAAERHADGEITNQELGVAISQVHRCRPKRSNLWFAAYYTARYSPGLVNWDTVTRSLADAAARLKVPNVPPTAMSYFEGEKLVTIQFPMTPERLAYDAAGASEYATQCTILYDIIGNPFNPSTIDPSWSTPRVIALSTTIYNERRFERMPELADVLEEAGCANDRILSHCREPKPHFKGCWLIDQLLGKN